MSICVRKLVTAAPCRQDELRVLRIAFDLPAQPADHRVDRSFCHVRVAVPHVLQQRRATEDNPWTRRTQVQEVELLLRELDGLAAHDDRAAVVVEGQLCPHDGRGTAEDLMSALVPTCYGFHTR